MPEAMESNFDQITNVHPVIFESIDGTGIRSAALHCSGSAGPSQIDADGWRRMCTSFGSVSIDLCNHLRNLQGDYALRILNSQILSSM